MSELLPVHPVTGLRAVGIVRGRPVWPILGADTNGDEATTTRLAEIDTRLEAVRSELIGFADRDLDDTEASRFDELETELGTLTTEREPLARRADTIERVRSATVTRRGLEHVGDGPTVQRTVKPYEDLDRVRSGQIEMGDLRSRALAAVEDVPESLLDDKGRERAEKLLRDGDKHGRIARHILLTGSPDYAEAFEAVLSGEQPWQLDDNLRRAMQFADEHRRAMGEGSGSAGAYLVPFHLDPTIILTNVGSTNPFRQISRVETIATNQWHGVSSAGVTAGYLGEGTEASDNSPSFAQPEVKIYKLAAYLQASFEVTQDTNIASSVGMLLADAKDRLEATEYAVGTGEGSNHITGVVTAVAAVSGSVVPTAAADTYAVGDVYNTQDALPDRWTDNASWVTHRKIASKTRQFATGTGQNTGAFWATLGMGVPPELLGAPLRRSSAMDSTIADNKNILLCGDFKQYLIVDRIGMSVQYDPLVKGSSQRPNGEVGWFAHWRGGGNCLVPDAFRLLQVLAA